MSMENIILLGYGLHILVLSIYLIVKSITRTNHFRSEMLIPMVLLPGAGLLMAFAVDYLIARGKAGSRSLDMEEFHLDTDIYWKSIKKGGENSNIVPLEEAITLNDPRIRRKLLLDTLFEDPKKFLDILLVARENPDTEITHYATTTISKIRSDYQKKIKDLSIQAGDFQSTPDALMNTLIAEIQAYIQSGLLEDNLLRSQRQKLDELLTERLRREPLDEDAIFQKIENNFELGRDADSKSLLTNLIKSNPLKSEVWLEAMDLGLRTGDPVFFQFIRTKLSENANKIEWTKEAYSKVAPWINERHDKAEINL